MIQLFIGCIFFIDLFSHTLCLPSEIIKLTLHVLVVFLFILEDIF